ncbi:uncharacterized protein C18orf19 homolog A [Vanessa tameamea]|uniref:Uncharacterized protein C18orf19 homolog A n=1 Tax=Vanessa tameamea TaxID=334116 RepID=A0A8B8HR90_VANTA|nr:uncharacterized protein C18orf19 homolog A [Vanessa tameamea]
MALSFRVLYKNNIYFQNITKPVKWNIKKNHPIRYLCNGIRCQNNIKGSALLIERELSTLYKPFRSCTTQSSKTTNNPPQDSEKKPGVIQRFKQMYKDYWYVLLPVHMTTSVIWFGGFYFFVRSGVDVIGLLETVGISEKLLSPLKESSAGYFALALALYKLVTPLRYAVTVGGTTYAINRLTAIGWIRPVPSRERMKVIFQEQKDNIQDKFNESKQHYQTQLKEKGTHVMDEMRRYKTEMRNIKNKVKKM